MMYTNIMMIWKYTPSHINSCPFFSPSDSYVNVNLYRPMKVFSGSFAERGQSPKQKALVDQEVAFEKVKINK